MANNPYSPPMADVTPQGVGAVGPRPATVYVGIGILAAVSAYALVSLVLYSRLGARFDTIREQGAMAYIIFLPAAVLLLQIVALVLAFLRKNWARIVLIVVLAWGMLTAAAQVYSFIYVMHRGTIAQMVPLFVIPWTLLAVRGVATGLLFTPSANAWFRQRGA
jgi:hypothetical protein